MKPIKFKEANSIYAKDQPPYLPLPVHITTDGVATSCWALTWKERVRVFFGAKIYWSQATFNVPLQPQRPSLDWKP